MLREFWILGIGLLALPLGGSADTSEVVPEPKLAVVELCSALEAIQRGDRLKVHVSGIFRTNGALTSSNGEACDRSVQPVTLVEFPTGLEKPAEMKELLARDGQVYADFSGTLWGPPRAKPDELELPTVIAYSRRLGQPAGYSGFRTKLVVEEVSNFWPVTSNQAANWRLTDRSPFPAVIRAALPVAYPLKARFLGLYGDVVVAVQVNGGKVVATTVMSAADRLLIEDTLASIKTFEFEPNVEAIFTTTFSYRYEDLPSTTTSIRLHTELPIRVEVIAPRDDW